MAFGSKGVTLAPGIYEVILEGIEPALKTFDWSSIPRGMIKFNVPALQATASYSVECGPYLVKLVSQLTGKNVFGSTPQELWEAAHDALIPVIGKWRGKVRVNYKGFVDQIQMPAGSYNFKFVRFSTRDKATGEAGCFEYTDQKTGQLRRRAEYTLEVTDGRFQGWWHTDGIGVSYKFTSETDLDVNEKSALFALLKAGGITEQDWLGLHAARKFNIQQSPMPAIEEILQAKALQGYEMAGVIDGERGAIHYSGLTSLGVVVNQEQEMVDLIFDLLKSIGQTMYGRPVNIVKPDGERTDDGVYLTRNIVGPLSQALPGSGVTPNWHPSKWGMEAMVKAQPVLSLLAEQDIAGLMLLIGESEKTHAAFMSWLVEHFPQLTGKQAAVSDGL